MEFKFGEDVNIPQGTRVKIKGTEIEGVIVGKSSTCSNQIHIIKCTNGILPNESYPWDTTVAPACFITVVEKEDEVDDQR